MYCGLSIASEVFLSFTTQQYQYFSVFLLFALVSDEPKVFLPKYSQTSILHAAHFWSVVNTVKSPNISDLFQNPCFCRGQNSLRHQGLSKGLSCFLPGRSVGALGTLSDSPVGTNYCEQLTRSSSSPALG